jgi:sodium-dependent dicarboxylate transporter 2/3/5
VSSSGSVPAKAGGADGSGGEEDLVAQFLRGGTYKGISEQRLSPAEERFERGRRTIGLFLAPLLCVLVLLLPLDIEQDQQTLAAVLALVICLWISEAVPIPWAA